MKLLVLLIVVVGCAHPPITRNVKKKLTPVERQQLSVDQCIHRFLDKGVLFTEATEGCANYIYRERRI